MRNAYEMWATEENEAGCATRTRSRPARRMTADEQHVREVGHIRKKKVRPDAQAAS